MKRIQPYILILLLLGGLTAPVRAQGSIQVVSDAASLSFPESLLFQAEFKAAGKITSVVLEYGVNQLTCGTVEAQAFPTFTPSADVKVEWTWEMRQSGSLPPGATVWWHWLVSGEGGLQFTSSDKTVLWLDNVHPWKTISGGDINLHFYNGSASFGQQLHDAAAQALVRLSQDVGVKADRPVDIYIYASSEDMQAAVLYEPAWSGGIAFAENNIVVIGIPTDQLDWGKSTEAHELTHVLVGHLTFTCLGFIPTWLNEGLAVYGEGGPQAYEQSQLDQAISNNTLMSLRSLGGNFPESDLSYLAYAESYSVVNFLIITYGRDKMTALLLDLRDGQTADEALMAVYGFNVDGLEAAWRPSVGAAALAGGAQPTQQPTPTEVPTFVPIGAAPLAEENPATPTPFPPAIATPTAHPTAIAPAATSPNPQTFPWRTLLIAGAVCLVLVLLLAGLVLLLALRGQKRRPK